MDIIEAVMQEVFYSGPLMVALLSLLGGWALYD